MKYQSKQMLFYFAILLLLLVFSRGSYSIGKSIIPHLTLFLIIALKGQVGCDYTGYLHRFYTFDADYSFKLATGEYGWYFVEYFTNLYQLDYQTYTIVAASLGVGFLFLAQKKIRYLGFLLFIYQMIMVQLGLSGVRQFIAVCIMTYAISDVLFSDKKSVIKFCLLLILAASFHISSLSLFFVVPFLFKVKTKHIILIGILCVAGFMTDVISSASDKYDTRYLEGTSESAGAWIRFFITCIFAYFAMIKASDKLKYLAITIIALGVIIGLINSVGLHRFNYYFLPIACLLFIKNIKEGHVTIQRIRISYFVSIFYFLFWFSFSSYSQCFIPYNFFFNI